MSEEPERYQILNEVGKGAMAIVYSAYDSRMGREVAIKVLNEEFSNNNEIHKRFLRESRAAGILRHPNIVTIYDVGEMHGKPFIAMELLHGRFLDELVTKGKEFDANLITVIARQLASALQCAHNNGVIHRDIKPANIEWTEETQQAKITDFGIAHLDNVTDTEATQVGQILGTPNYMSPEQIKGRKVDSRSDLFSLGVLLYQLATKQRPFSGDTLATLTYQIAHTTPPSISQYNEQIPHHLIQLINRLLEKDPNDRFQSCDEFIEALNDPLNYNYKPLPQASAEHHDASDAHQYNDQTLATATLNTSITHVAKQFKKPQNLTLLLLFFVTIFLGYLYITQFKTTQQISNTTSAPNTQSQDALDSPEQNEQQVDSEQVLPENLQPLVANIKRFECSELDINVDGEAVNISGHLSNEEDIIALMDLAESIPDINNITYDIRTLVWPFCEIKNILSAKKHKNVKSSKNLQLTIDNNKSEIVRGENLKFTLLTPLFDSYIYVDYYRSDGSVVHLYPDDYQSHKITAASTIMNLAENDNIWKKDEPIGENMLVVMSSHKPITSNRRAPVEAAQMYLTHLHRQIVVNQYELISNHLTIYTRENNL